MSQRTNVPVALTIAGSDSGGGAGIQADLKTFAALGAHGTCAITCVTAQNPERVVGLAACKPEFVIQQIEAVLAEWRVGAIKTGMLHSAGIVRQVARYFRDHPPKALIVDPVMVATSGRRLLEPKAARILMRKLLPLATLVTPNLDETEALIGRRPQSVEDMRKAAREIRNTFGCAALVKGGHLPRMREAVDIFFDGKTELLLSGPFVTGLRTHGTGCTYSAAITGYRALGCELTEAVGKGKDFVTRAIMRSQRAGRCSILNHLG